MTSQLDAIRARWLARRIAAAPNENVAEIMAIEDKDERWKKLREGGYCGYGCGACRSDNGKIAKCEIKPSDGRPYRECAAHRKHYSELTDKYRSSAYQRRAPKHCNKSVTIDPNSA
jgi:hypothetical protein